MDDLKVSPFWEPPTAKLAPLSAAITNGGLVLVGVFTHPFGRSVQNMAVLSPGLFGPWKNHGKTDGT